MLEHSTPILRPCLAESQDRILKERVMRWRQLNWLWQRLGELIPIVKRKWYKFDETNHVRWRTMIHDEGWSSPVVWDGLIWLTTARKDGSELFAVCVDLASGKVVHDVKVFDVAEPQVAFDGYNTHATPTPVVEADRIYVHFGAYGTACLDTRTGAKLWERRDLKCDHRVRPASSPIVDGERLFLVFDGIDAQFIVALDKQTGATRWQRERKSGVDFEASLKAAGITDTKGTAKKKPNDNRKAYATPTLIEHAGRKQLVSPAAEVTISYDPSTGEELWRVRHEGLGWNSSCRPIYHDGEKRLNHPVLFVCGEEC